MSRDGFTKKAEVWLRLLFFPQTACSLRDLDQAVAAAAGAIIPAFTLYAVARLRFERQETGEIMALTSVDVDLEDRIQPEGPEV